MKNLKKIVAIILVLVMSLSMAAIFVSAEDASEEKVTNWVEITDPTDNWVPTPTEPTTLFTPEQESQLSDMGDSIRDIVDSDVNILQWVADFFAQIKAWIEGFFEDFGNLISNNPWSK